MLFGGLRGARLVGGGTAAFQPHDLLHTGLLASVFEAAHAGTMVLRADLVTEVVPPQVLRSDQGRAAAGVGVKMRSPGLVKSTMSCSMRGSGFCVGW